MPKLKLNVPLLRKFKKDHFITHAWFSSKLGVSESTVAHMFSDGHIPEDKTMTKLAVLMKCQIDELIIYGGKKK